MAKRRTRLPVIFVGHPFRKRFPVEKFRSFFRDLPFNVVYGNTDIETKHLLRILKGHINQADYCIFDLTFWNPNVALELGMAEGLHRDSIKRYFVLLNSNKSKEIPSAIKGYQRLEYTKLDYSHETGLGNRLIELLKKEYWTEKILREIRNRFEDHSKVDKALEISLRVLGHFKYFRTLSNQKFISICKGTRFIEQDRKNIVDILTSLRIISSKNKILKLKRKSLFLNK